MPSELLAVADADVIQVAPVVGGVGLEDGRHDLGELFANFGCRLWLAVVCGSSEVEAFGNEWLVLEEAIKMVSIFKIILSAQRCYKETFISVKEKKNGYTYEGIV